MFTGGGGGGGPKLEDFLGGGGGACTASNAEPASVFSADQTTVAALSSAELYESELKTIAASFLRGFNSNNRNNNNNSIINNFEQQIEVTNNSQLVPSSVVAPVDPAATSKKTVDTFGQRTSIYRGVTR